MGFSFQQALKSDVKSNYFQSLIYLILSLIFYDISITISPHFFNYYLCHGRNTGHGKRHS